MLLILQIQGPYKRDFQFFFGEFSIDIALHTVIVPKMPQLIADFSAQTRHFGCPAGIKGGPWEDDKKSKSEGWTFFFLLHFPLFSVCYTP